MTCPDCVRRDKTIQGLRAAIGRWQAKAKGAIVREPMVVQESLDRTMTHRTLIQTLYPAEMPAREVWEAVCGEYGDTVERIETRGGMWLAQLRTWMR